MNEDTSLKPHERYVLDAGEWGTTDAMAKQRGRNGQFQVCSCKDAGRELF